MADQKPILPMFHYNTTREHDVEKNSKGVTVKETAVDGETTPTTSVHEASTHGATLVGVAENSVLQPQATDPILVDRPTKGPLTVVGRGRRKGPKPRAADKFFENVNNLAPGVKFIIAAVLTSIPFVVFYILSHTIYSGRKILDHGLKKHHQVATYNQLSLWLLAVWAAAFIIFVVAVILAFFGAWACQLSTQTIKYAPLARSLCFRLCLLAWVGAAHFLNCKIWWQIDAAGLPSGWVYHLKQSLVYLIIAFTVILVQGFVLQMMSISYIDGYVGPRAERATSELDTFRELNNLVKQHISHDDPGILAKFFRKLFVPKKRDAYTIISKGEGNEAIFHEYAMSIWKTIAGNKQVLTATDIAARLRHMDRDPDAGEELFEKLDESCDGEVTEEELRNLVTKTGLQLNKRAVAMNGIQNLLGKLEFLLTVVMFIVIVFIYTNFFPQSWAKDVKALGTFAAGVGFAVNGTITTFVEDCVYVFAKHSYDVGDIVEIKGLKLLVCQVFLTYTNFEEMQADGKTGTGKFVHMSHKSISPETVLNWTRSRDVLAQRKEEKEEEKLNEKEALSADEKEIKIEKK